MLVKIVVVIFILALICDLRDYREERARRRALQSCDRMLEIIRRMKKSAEQNDNGNAG